MGTCGQPGYVFPDFFLKQGIDFIIFCLNQGIDFINFCLRVSYVGDKQPVHMFYELNYGKSFTRSFRVNVLNRVLKIRILS